LSNKHAAENSLHDKLSRRIVVECVIESRGPIHVGVGKETSSVSAVDMPIVVDGNRVPVVPGSSIRGALRAHVTRLLSSLDESTLKSLFGTKKIEATEDDIRKFLEAESIDEKMDIFCESFGVVAKLFGVSGYASPLRLTDATLIGEKTKPIERTHVRIDNDLDRAVEGGLFDVEAVPENRKFKFKIIFDELSNPVMKDANKVFYKVLLKSIGDGGLEMFLGGMKSRGYGLCVIKAERILPYTPKELALGETPKPYTNVALFVYESLKEG